MSEPAYTATEAWADAALARLCRELGLDRSADLYELRAGIGALAIAVRSSGFAVRDFALAFSNRGSELERRVREIRREAGL